MSLKNAYMLDFSNNNFYGKLPNDITQSNFNKLRLLYLNNNAFAGTIPDSLMQFRKIKGLFLNDNCENYLLYDDFLCFTIFLTDVLYFQLQCLPEEFLIKLTRIQN